MPRLVDCRRRLVLVLIFPAGGFRFLMIEPVYFLDVDRWFRQLEFHVLERVNDNLRHRQISEPLVVGRNHEPGRVVCRATRQSGFECLNVVVPIVSFSVVDCANLPLMRWIVEALLESSQLFVFGYRKNFRIVVSFSIESSLSQLLMKS